MEHGAVIPVIDSKDRCSIFREENNGWNAPVKLVQTPQTFLSKILLPALQ